MTTTRDCGTFILCHFAIKDGVYGHSEIITSDKEREKIKQQREEFYKDSKIQTDNITVEIKKASEALYNERTIGYVEAKVTVEGKRNDDSFTNKYDLVLLMDYQEDVASVYEVVDIKTE